MVDVVGGAYVQGPGGYYRKDDRSGPYSIDSSGQATFIGATSRAAPLMTTSSTVHGSPQDLGLLFKGETVTVQLGITTAKTATVLLFARLDTTFPWAKFETVSLTDEGFINPYTGFVYLAWQVTVIDSAATVTLGVGYYD
jgi:hypothetical protein